MLVLCTSPMVPGMLDDLQGQTSNAEQAIVKLKRDANVLVKMVCVDTANQTGGEITRPRLLFPGVCLTEYEKIIGDLPLGWEDKLHHVLTTLDSVDLGIRLQDVLLPRNHPYVLQDEAVAIQKAAIPVHMRPGVARVGVRKSRKRKANDDDDDEVSYHEENQRPQNGSNLRKTPSKSKRKPRSTKPWGEQWIDRHIDWVSKMSNGTMSWVHPEFNSGRCVYRDNAFFLQLSWREQDVILLTDMFFDVGKAVPGTGEEFVDVSAWQDHWPCSCF